MPWPHRPGGEKQPSDWRRLSIARRIPEILHHQHQPHPLTPMCSKEKHLRQQLQHTEMRQQQRQQQMHPATATAAAGSSRREETGKGTETDRSGPHTRRHKNWVGGPPLGGPFESFAFISRGPISACGYPSLCCFSCCLEKSLFSFEGPLKGGGALVGAP